MNRGFSGHRWKKTLASALFLAFVLLKIPFTSEAAELKKFKSDWNIREDLMRLSKEAPSLTSLGGGEGIIWMRHVDYELTAAGSMMRHERWLLLAGQALPDSWIERQIGIPPGSHMEVGIAGWYNPMTTVREGTLELKANETPDGQTVTFSVPKEVAGRVVAIEYLIENERHYFLDDALFLAYDLPAWEQRVSVRAPLGKEFFWSGRAVGDPVHSREDITDRYVWTVMNQMRWRPNGIIADHRPAVVFSTREGLVNALTTVEKMSEPFLSMPADALQQAAQGAQGSRAVSQVLALLRGVRSQKPFAPANAVRDVAHVRADTQWTQWEQAFLLAGWFRSAGYKTRLWWLPNIAVNGNAEKIPAGTATWALPVVGVTIGGMELLCVAGQSYEPQAVPFRLSGETLYTLEGAEPVTKKLSAGSAGSNRLSVAWNGRLAENGTFSGEVTIYALGEWDAVLGLSGQSSRNDEIAAFLKQFFLISAQNLDIRSAKVTPNGTGYKITAQTTSASGIPSGQDILLRLPGMIPDALKDIAQRKPEFFLRFPFIVEQTVQVATPPGYGTILLVPAEKRENDGMAYEESLTHWPRKGILNASFKWTVKKTRVTEQMMQPLMEELSLLTRWSELTVPLRKK